MIIEENWAIAPERVREFFAAQPDSEEIPEGFSVGGCVVSLTESEGRLLGKWNKKRTNIRFEGEELAIHAVHHRFFLRFLSAGG